MLTKRVPPINCVNQNFAHFFVILPLSVFNFPTGWSQVQKQPGVRAFVVDLFLSITQSRRGSTRMAGSAVGQAKTQRPQPVQTSAMTSGWPTASPSFGAAMRMASSG